MRELKNCVRMSLPISPIFNWSVGNHMERFFQGLREKKILASRCSACGRVFLPPRMICERCFEKTEEWVELTETASLVSFTTAHVKVDEKGLLADEEGTEIIGMLCHDGADTCLVAPLRGIEPGAVKTGMALRIVWKDSPEGVLDAIQCYEPAEGGA
ncbi:MAG: Zn-ribbon domain-containing OB-fold protein [Candidatus Geothermincolia bacterium]